MTCINRDYLAEILFFKKREAENKKKKDKLEDAQEWLEKTKKITEEAISNEEDFKILVPLYEKIVAKIESEVQLQDKPAFEDFKEFVKEKCANEEWYDLHGKAMSKMENNKRFVVICQLLLIWFLFH